MNNFFAHTLRFLANVWFSRPGWLVKKLTKPTKLNQQLTTLNHPLELTTDKIARIKQTICNFIFLYFFIDILITGRFFHGIFLDFSFCIITCHIPEFIFHRLIKRKKKLITKQLPDFIDTLTLAIESGMNFSNAFAYISQRTNSIINLEATKTQHEINFGIPESEAIKSMAKRIDVEEFSKFTNALKQAKELGVSIAKTLRIQSDLIRTRRKQKAEELSRTASVKISLPLVFCIFPALLIIYLAPGILRLIAN